MYMYNYCDLRGRIKGTARALFSIIVHACCMTNKARLSRTQTHTHTTAAKIATTHEAIHHLHEYEKTTSSLELMD